VIYPLKRVRIYSEEIKEANREFSLTLFEVENAVLAFFNEGEKMRVGTFSIAMPSISGETPIISSILLGDRNTATTRILAERLAASYGKMALVSTFIKGVDEAEAGRILMKLTQKFLEKRRKK
jgi:hypothetical protein